MILFSIHQENPLENLNTAFNVAEQHLDIPRMLDPEGNYYVFIFNIFSVFLFSHQWSYTFYLVRQNLQRLDLYMQFPSSGIKIESVIRSLLGEPLFISQWNLVGSFCIFDYVNDLAHLSTFFIFYRSYILFQHLRYTIKITHWRNISVAIIFKPVISFISNKRISFTLTCFNFFKFVILFKKKCF